MGELAKHEWLKHGTCSGLEPHRYFAEALRAMQALPGNRGTPAIITASVGGSVPTSAVRNAYDKQVAIRTDKGCSLAEVTSCWMKAPDGTVGPQVDCPAHVMGGRDTHCSVLRITALGECLKGRK